MKTMTLRQALPLLCEGAILQTAESPALIRLRPDGLYALQGLQYQARLSEEDFCALFENAVFFLRQSAEGIDPQKDEEYYAWRERSQ